MNNKIKTIVNGLKNYIDSKTFSSRGDWNQNDASAENYIKNRPFYEEDNQMKFYLNEMTIDGFSESGELYQVRFEGGIKLDEPIVFGEKYTILYDGKEYIATLQDEEGVLYFGINYYYPSHNPDNLPFGISVQSSWNSETEQMYTTRIECVCTNSSTSASHTIAIYKISPVIHQIDPKYLPSDLLATVKMTKDSKMDKDNPTGTGSFSMNRKDGTTIGTNSHAEGYNTTASGIGAHAEGGRTTSSGSYSHTEGHDTTASGNSSHAEGNSTTASGDWSHAEGCDTWASGQYSHAGGYNTKASGYTSHSEGNMTTASGHASHSEGNNTTAYGSNSHAEGWKTKASGKSQHVQGQWNIDDVDVDGKPLNTYAHIVGNGESDGNRSNAHTLDWDGNAWFQGAVYVGGTSQTDASKLATESFVKTKTTLTITQDATNTLASTADTQNWAEQTEYHPNQEMCFTRIFCTTSGDMTADTAYAIGTLADTSYAPGYTTPLNVMCGKQIQAYIGSTGTIYIKPYEATYGTIPVRLSGFWFK